MPILAFAVSAAQAVDVEVEGLYRARGSIFDSLSLDHALTDSEGLSFAFDHRLWLRPILHVSDAARVLVDVRALDGVAWGTLSTPVTSAVPGAPPTFDTTLSAPVGDTDPSDALQDITLWRAWTEFDTVAGRFRVGRQPVHWGEGIWWNDGLQTAPTLARYGDSVDRLAWELLVEDEFFVGLSIDVLAEGFVGVEDDTTAFSGHVAYRSELVHAGLLAHVAHTVDPDLTVFSLDGAADATLGRLRVAGEAIGQFGGGAVADIGEGVSVTSVGAVTDVSLDLAPWTLRLRSGLATGDGQDRDLRLKTFTFDRDYSVGLVLFEHPMPTLAAAAPNDVNGGRSTDDALTGDAVHNALYLNPSVRRRIVEGLAAEASWLGARTAKVPDSFGDRNSYGMEFGLGVQWEPTAGVTTGLSGAVFLPGSYFENFEHEDGGVFDDPVYGGLLEVRAAF
jgi:hypothetical protein